MLNRRQGLKAAAALTGLSATPAWAEAPTVISLSEQRNRFFVDVEINGQSGFRFVLDTGATTHFISSRLVEQLGLREVDSRTARDFGGRLRQGVVAISSLTVGGAALGRATAVAWPADRLEDHDGLIGYPFLLPNAVLNLSAGQISRGGLAPERMIPVKAEVMRNQTLLLGGIDGVEGRFVFDTGSQNCIVSPAYLRRIGATDAFQAATKLVRRNAQGDSEVVAFRPSEISFGALRIANPTLRIAATDPNGSVLDTTDGLFGVALIKPYAWALDQARRTLKAGPAV